MTHSRLQRHSHQITGIQLTQKFIELPLKSLGPELKREYPFQSRIRRFDTAELGVLMMELIGTVVEDLLGFRTKRHRWWQNDSRTPE